MSLESASNLFQTRNGGPGSAVPSGGARVSGVRGANVIFVAPFLGCNHPLLAPPPSDARGQLTP
jgi:hypothetical protein